MIYLLMLQPTCVALSQEQVVSERSRKVGTQIDIFASGLSNSSFIIFLPSFLNTHQVLSALFRSLSARFSLVFTTQYCCQNGSCVS